MLTPAELVWLIAAVAKGDEAAFERLYAATRAKLFGVVLRILRRQDLAEEVIQEAYVKIWNNAGQFNPALASPITWMASIARNRAIDVVRKKSEISIEEEPTAIEVAADSPDPLARREMTEELKRLLECVGRLEPDRQKLVLLAYYHGWEYRLGVLNQMVGSVEPRPIVWENIKAAIGHSTEQQAPLVLPEAAPPAEPAPPPAEEPVVAEAPPVAVDHSNVIQLTGRVR